MRIKRFQAPDMRSALRMIRDEQGPDAVILSNRAFAGGIEVVAATDYDEALVAQALRAAAPGIEPLPAATTEPALPAPAAIAAQGASTARQAVTPAAASAPDSRQGDAPRDSLMARARAAFGLGAQAPVDDGPTLAELSTTGVVTPPGPDAQPRSTPADGARFDAFMAAFNGDAPTPVAPAILAPASPPASGAPALASLPVQAPMPEAPAAHADLAATTAPVDTVEPESESGTGSEFPDDIAMPVAPVRSDDIVAPVAPLRLVVPEPTDPALEAMRTELAQMRQLMEAQMSQLSLERLRGSPARAACFDALVAMGCEAELAQAVAAKLDPTLPVDAIAVPMQAELARMLDVARAEPIEDGGVIALVGPTGAGKTTTAAKLAARFAARHRARDVALVSMDDRRAGAREQLQAHGRQLGITVCEAVGPEGLSQALAQLVDYPLVLIDTAGHGPRDRVLLRQILWLRAERAIRSLLVLPANAHPDDLGEVVRRYRPAAPTGVVLTKLDEASRPGAALSVAQRLGLPIAYACRGQGVPGDIEAADPLQLARILQESRRAADTPFVAEDRPHAV